MKIKDLMNESSFDDLGLKGLGSELDRDDEYGQDFKAPRMFQQLAKCADNRMACMYSMLWAPVSSFDALKIDRQRRL